MEWIHTPQLNANEEELDVVEVNVEEGQQVRRGEVLCTLESTKATVDVEAPRAGFVRALSAVAGERVRVGEPLCGITESREEPVTVERPAREAGEGPRATRRAEELADQYGLDLSRVPTAGIVTEKEVLRVLEKNGADLRSPEDRPGPPAATPMVKVRRPPGTAIVILGAGGHARVVIDTLREGRRDLHLLGIVDDGERPPADVLGVPILGDSRRLMELRERGVTLAALGVGAVTHNALRAELFQRLRRQGFHQPNLIHPRAVVEPSAHLGEGNQIFAGAVVSSAVRLGDGCIVNSGAVVSHDCVLGDHVHVTPGAVLAGGVSIGDRTVVGMASTVYLGVTVGRDVVLTNGSHVFHDVADETVWRAQDQSGMKGR